MAFLFKSKKKKEIVSPNFMTAKDPSAWNVDEVCSWLGQMNLADLKPVFQERAISGADLVAIEDRDLDSLKIVKFADRKKLLNSIRNLTNKDKLTFDTISRSSGSTGQRSNNASETGSSTSDSDWVQELEVPMTVKCYYNEDIRSFDMETLSLEHLKERIEEEYGQQFLMKYKDDEDELVSLNTNGGLKLATRHATHLKLYLTPLQMLSDAELKILEGMVDGVVIIDTKGTMVYVNAALEKMFGYNRKQLILKNIKILMNKKDGKKHNGYMERYMETGISQIIGKGRVVECRNSEGADFKGRLSVSETKRDGKHYFTGTITKVENDDSPTLVTSANFMIIDSFLDATVVINDQGTVMFFNKAAEAMFGYSKGEVHGRNVKLLMPEPFKSEHDAFLSNYNRSGVSKIMNTGRDVPVQKKDGTISTFNLKLSKQEIGAKIFYTGVFSKAAEEKDVKTLSGIAQEREVLKELLIPAIVIDTKGMIQGFNEAASKTFGYSVGDVIGKSVNILMPDDIAARHDSFIQKHMETGVNRIIGIGRKVQAKKRDGTLFDCKLFVTKKSDGTNTYFTGVLQLE